ncbi:START-like domain [Plasmopara halstedii]|uniref:START-like domain n=1 Tax=Plasmopara halstedii TaxID=4781 RepID=A0A0N7L4T0_PLAHL|nr:START-like domain [Plasmopara halstedii]CEG39531.1 START-like domain [Plasmopara halstedii]|eukprot:XP_024575900.1 START-like domain [Plasmopara halstedii]
MGKATFTTNPYPKLELTDADRQLLLRLESDLILEVFPKYEDFVVVDKRKVNHSQWKSIGDDENLHVYVERDGYSDSKIKEDDPVHQPTDNWQKNMPIILAVGTFEGELNDLMFGTVNPTQEIMRVKASYVKDYSDGAVLANIVVPTAADPFRSVSIKWTQINLPLNQTGLIQNRDFICLEATGILHFADGDRVGYQLLHSINFPNTQPLLGTIRAHHKIIGFYRQISHNVIDTYAFDTVHPGGKIFRSVALKASAQALLSTTNYVICGQAKKLTWRLQHRQAETQSFRHRCTQNIFNNELFCTACDRNLTHRNFGLPRVTALGQSVCKLCLNPVCYKCKRPKAISFLTPDRKLLRQKITFCVMCISEVSRMSAIPAAQDQAVGYKAFNVMDSLSGSDVLSNK